MLTTIGEGVDEEESSRINMVGSVNIEDSEDFRDRTLEFRSLVGTLKPSSEAFKYQQEEVVILNKILARTLFVISLKPA